MAPNDTKTLHEKHDPRLTGLLSLMDIMGPQIVCDECGRWQRLNALAESDARRLAAESGWSEVEDRDLCPICTSASTPEVAVSKSSKRVTLPDWCAEP